MSKKHRKKRIAELEAANQRLQKQLDRSRKYFQEEYIKQEGAREALAKMLSECSESEYFLRLAIDNIPAALFWKNSDNIYLGCNQNFAKIVGLESAAEIRGKSDEDLPKKGEKVKLFPEGECWNSQERKIIEYREQDDGSRHWWEMNKIIIKDGEGNAIGMLGIIADITERVQRAEKLKQQAIAMAATTDGIAILTQEGYIYLNQAHAQMFGYDFPEELLGESWQFLYDAEEIARFEREIMPILMQQGYWRGEATAKRKDGSTFFQELSLNITEEGAIICICRDITERKQAEASLWQLKEELEQRVESRTRELRASEARLQRLAAIVAVAIFEFRLNPDGTRSFPYVSEGCRDIYELEPDNFIQCFDLVHTDDIISLNAAIAESARSSGRFEHEHRIITPSGTHKWVRAIGRPERLEDGTIIWDGLIIDTSDRKRAEAELEASQAELLALIGAIQDVIMVLDRSGRYLKILPSGAPLLYQPPSNLLGKTLHEVLPPQGAEFFANTIHQVLAEGKSARREYNLPIGDRLVWFDATVTPMADDRVLWVARDISDRKHQEVALRQSSQLISQQVRRSQLLYQLTQQIRNSLDFNQILNTTVREIQDFLKVDRCHFAWYVEEADHCYWDVVAEVQATNLPSFIGRHRTSDFGPLSELLLSRQTLRLDDVAQIEDVPVRDFVTALGNRSMLVLPVWDNAGGRYGIIACIHAREVRPWKDDEVELLEAAIAQLAIALNQGNILAQSQARAQELEQTLHQLQRTQTQLIQSEKMSSLGQMVAGVAHEINNPVSFIHGNLFHAEQYMMELIELLDLYQQHYREPHDEIADKIESIELDFLKEDLRKLFQSMGVGTERIREIVKSLRNFSRLDEADFKEVNLHEGIDSALMILQSRLRATDRRSEIAVIKEYSPLPRIKCYAGELNQVFLNIIANAIDALSERTPQLREQDPSTIRIQTQTHSESVTISITDNGPGICPAIMTKLFDPFFTTKAIGKGTGLGLSISYQIVTEKHNGQLYCTSQPGATTFTIELPMRANN